MDLKVGRQFYKLVVVAWLTFSFGSVVLALLSWHQLTARMEYGKQMTLTREELLGVCQSLLDLETGERGYVITGDETFLEPFNQVKASAVGAIRQPRGAGSRRSGNAGERHEAARRMPKRASPGSRKSLIPARKSFDKAAGDGFRGQVEEHDG